ncbi:MAG: DinB family protein [Flavobacteriales bacterium]|nr:DinB family protein [Flavobacteriales bacterium]
MKTLHVATVLDELQNIVQTNLAFAKDLQENHIDRMFESPGPGKWSAVQCLEHLNRYAAFYHPEIEDKLNSNGGDPHYKPSWLGNYFAMSMLPTEKMKTMTTFKSKDPVHDHLDISVLRTFIGNQERMLSMIEKARKSDLGKVKCKTTLGSWLKFKLGDTFRFVIYHELRHIEQARKAVLG